MQFADAAFRLDKMVQIIELPVDIADEAVVFFYVAANHIGLSLKQFGCQAQNLHGSWLFKSTLTVEVNHEKLPVGNRIFAVLRRLKQVLQGKRFMRGRNQHLHLSISKRISQGLHIELNLIILYSLIRLGLISQIQAELAVRSRAVIRLTFSIHH